MRTIGLFLVLMLMTFTTFSQSANDSIEIRQSLGKVYKQHGKNLSMKDLYAILGTNEKAVPEMNKSKANSTPALILACAGGAFIGWPVGTALGGGNPEWWLAGVGAGLIICSIPLITSANRHLCNAVIIYNSDLKKIGIREPVLQIGASSTGVGISVRF